MTKTVKFWTGLGIAAVSGTMIAEAATIDLQGENAPPALDKIILADSGESEGGESGESAESGEGEGGASRDDGRIGYLTGLGLVEGHMRAGVELYKKGDEGAMVHMKHPADELYADLKPHFEAMKFKGFDAELDAVAKAVEGGSPVAEVETAFGKLQAAILVARGESVSSHEVAETVEHLVRTAADEYAVGVEDGKVVDAREYQDAWGFVQAAKRMVAALPEKERKEHAGQVGEIEAELEKIQVLWPDITGKSPVTADPTLLPAAAARIELAAHSIK